MLGLKVCANSRGAGGGSRVKISKVVIGGVSNPKLGASSGIGGISSLGLDFRPFTVQFRSTESLGKDSLQSVDLLASWAVCSRFPAFVSCHPKAIGRRSRMCFHSRRGLW